MTWHLPAQTLRDYTSGDISSVDSWSVEAHLSRCQRCRSLLAQWYAADDLRRQRLDQGWAALAAALPPQAQLAPGTRRRQTRMLLAGGPAARGAWLLACTIVLVLAAMMGVWGGGVPWLGVVAPLAPLAGVAVSYGSRLDAVREALAATPAGGLRLLLLRTASVLAATTPIALVAGYLSGYGSPAPWLLASLVLTVATLALATVLSIEQAAAVSALGWLVAVGSALLGESWRTPVVLTPQAAPWMFALAAVAVVVITVRRQSFHHRVVPSRMEVLR